MKEFTPREWVVDEANFNEFIGTMVTDEEFKTQTENLLKVIEEEKDPYVRMEAYWNHNQWIHDNGYVHIKDALWDYIDGRR